jgi:molybdenum-dependent DNA-binding transcriptional regulator ModE
VTVVVVNPRVVFVSDGEEITHRQLEALLALHEKGSMKKASALIGISAPVLYKYIREVEAKTGLELVRSTSRGSTLTPDGKELIGRFKAYELRLRDDRILRVAGTLVSERCVLTAASAISEKGVRCRVTVSTDEENLGLADRRSVDCVVLDDAMYAMERAPESEGTEIGSDVLMHRDAGPEYARLAFGAQRLGFRYLEQKGAAHSVVREVWEPALLDQTDLSYFVNRSLVRRGVVCATGAKEQKWSVHSVIGLPCSEHPDLRAFIAEARRAGLYPKG